MAHHKAYLFNSTERSLAAYCKALAHPARTRIYHSIKEEGIIPFERICKLTPLAAATVQDHLLRLQLVQLIEVMGDESGKIIGYRLNKEVEEEMKWVFESIVRGGRLQE